jgi:hypothetical protein
MNSLAKYEVLGHSIRIYVPSTVEVVRGAIELQADVVQRTMTIMGKCFGGSTAYNAQGAWISEQVGLVIEQVVIVESFATADAVSKHLPTILEYCLQLRKEMKQEAVAMEYDNRLYLVK